MNLIVNIRVRLENQRKIMVEETLLQCHLVIPICNNFFSFIFLGFFCEYCVPLPPLRGQHMVLCHPRWLLTSGLIEFVMCWGGAGFEPRTTDLQSGALPLSHLSSTIEPPLLHHWATSPPTIEPPLLLYAIMQSGEWIIIFSLASTPSTIINAQSLQLKMWLIFLTEKSKINVHLNGTKVIVWTMYCMYTLCIIIIM